MAFSDLRNLYKLHLIDSQIVEIRKTAAALDPGRQIMAEIKALENQKSVIEASWHALHSEQQDLELQAKALQDKINGFDKQLYGGSIVNPREVEAMQKEIEILKKRRGDLDERTLELLDLVPAEKKKSEPYDKAIAVKKRELVEHQKKAMELKTKLEADFKSANAARPAAAALVPKDMLVRYDAIRNKLDGVGMCEYVKGSCSACGTKMPEKIVEAAKSGRIVTCESCHRIVFASDGLI